MLLTVKHSVFVFIAPTFVSKCLSIAVSYLTKLPLLRSLQKGIFLSKNFLKIVKNTKILQFNGI